MSLGNVLLRPQLVMPGSAPTIRQLDLLSDLGIRLGRALLTDQAAQEIFAQTFGELSNQFLRNHEHLLENSLDRLLGWVQPAVSAVNEVAQRIGSTEVLAIPGAALDLVCELLQGLSQQRVEAAIGQLLDVIENDLQDVMHNVPAGLLAPIFEQLVTRLGADHLVGDMSEAALTRYLLGRDLTCLRHMILDALPSIELDRELIVQLVRQLLARIGLDGVAEKAATVCEAIKGVGSLLQTLFSAQLSGSVEVSTSGMASKARAFSIRTADADSRFGPEPSKDRPRRHLWYATWLLGRDLYQQGELVFEDDLKLQFHGDGMFRASLEIGGDLVTVREQFAAHDIRLGSTLVVTREPGKPQWTLRDQSNEKTYTIFEDDGGADLYVYEGRIYLESDWSRIDLLRGYTFEHVSPGACDVIAWVMNFSGEFLEMLAHAVSIESTDFVSNLLNLLIHGTYGALKLVGPRGFGWTKRDLPMRNPWLNWVLPIGATVLASLENIHTKDEAPHAMMYWVTLLGADVVEKFLYDHWAYMLRDAVLSGITLVNYDGARNVPAGLDDTRPLNRKHVDGIVNLFVEAGVWIVSALYPKSDFGFPNNDNMDKLGTLFGHWLGFGLLTQAISTLVGSLVAWAMGWVVDWPTYGWMNLKACLFTLIKYNIYQYFTHDGKTNGGKFDGAGDGYPGYATDPEQSPYKLPYERGVTYQCAQGNLGVWSHTPHSGASQIYAYDFAMDKGDVILSCRAGIVDDFEDKYDDHNSDDPNFIRIRHDVTHTQDRDRSNNQVVTYATYLHGTSRGVREVWAEWLGLDIATITKANIVGQPVLQGQPIMKAGDTGRSAYNHLHLHVKPQVSGGQGGYTIPFVFADVSEDDGRPRSLNAYTSDNERKTPPP